LPIVSVNEFAPPPAGVGVAVAVSVALEVGVASKLNKRKFITLTRQMPLSISFNPERLQPLVLFASHEHFATSFYMFLSVV
jgi:hypothetical protein